MNNNSAIDIIKKAHEQNSTYVNLSRMNLTSLPSEIKILSNLEILDLNNNRFTHFPSELFCLKTLVELDLSNNNISTIPSDIKYLNNIQDLCLGKNKITILPEELLFLSNLECLDLSDNSIEVIPDWITNLINLKQFFIQNNKISYLPKYINRLKKLKQLYIYKNEISEIPQGISYLVDLDDFKAGGNPLQKPPEEICKRGLWSIREYFKDLKDQGEEFVFEAKLIIVGEPGSGKTSLTNKLIDPSTPLLSEIDEGMTKGIDIRYWKFQITSSNEKSEHTDFMVNIWDFGGQDIMHSTHRYFLTKRSLYILLADNRKEDTDFYYWLENIEFLSLKSPVIIVQNEKFNHRKYLPSDIFKHFDSIVDSANINLANNYNLENLRFKIKEHLQGLSHIGKEPIPKKWVAVRHFLENEKRHFITLEEYYKICYSFGISDQRRSLHISEFLHDLGVILHFQDDKQLREIIILNTRWATEAVYLVLFDSKVVSAFGNFETNDLDAIWTSPLYPSKHHTELLKLMTRFELCYQINNTERYIIPELLPERFDGYDHEKFEDYFLPKYENIPDFEVLPGGHTIYRQNDIESTSKDKLKILYFDYHYVFMPKGIISRLIVRMNKYIYKGIQWKSGVVLEIENSKIEIREIRYKRQLKIKITGGWKRESLAIIRKEMNDLHDNYEEIMYSEMVSCVCEECLQDKNPHLFKFDLIRKYISNKRILMTCEKSLIDVNVFYLLDNMYFIPQQLKEKSSDVITTFENLTIFGGNQQFADLINNLKS